MAAWKHRQESSKCMPEDRESPAAIEWTLPADLLLEIVARSDARTLIRCAAASRLLRHDILYPSFIDRVTQQGGIVPPCFLAYLNTHDEEADPQPPLSLVHPTTPVAVSFLDEHMSSYMSRYADDLLDEYYPVTSRGGLALLRRRHVSNMLSNLCVYNLITGHRNFLSDPPDFLSNSTRRYVLLTSVDGIGCSFMLLLAELDFMTDFIKIQTTTSTCGTWAPATMIHKHIHFLQHAMHHDAVVLHGGVTHWLVPNRDEIVTYNICTMEQGTIGLPVVATKFNGLFCLGSYYSHDGQKLLRLIASKGFKIYVWHQVAGGEWASEPVKIDMEEKLLSLYPGINTGQIVQTDFKWSGEGSNTVVMRIYVYPYDLISCSRFIVLDIETKEMHLHQKPTPHSSVLLEIDLPSRLHAMQPFP